MGRFFGSPAKDFSGLGGQFFGPSQPSSPASLTQFALNSDGFIAAGIFTNGTSKPVVRRAASATALATATDIPIVTAGTFCASAYAPPGMYVVGDNVGGIFTATSADQFKWHTAVNGGASLTPGSAGVYDETNLKVIIATFANGGIVTAPVGSGVVTFTAHNTGSSNQMIGLSHRPGTNVTLAITASGGVDQGSIYRTTDGGATWARTQAQIFGAGVNNSYYVFYAGANTWLAFGGDGTIGLLCVSTDNGSTWSAPAPWGGEDGSMQIASDGAGTLLMLGPGVPPNNYFVSTDLGATWSPPGVFADQDGFDAFGLVWTGTAFAANFIDANDLNEFFATTFTSLSGLTWAPGPNVVDT